MDSNYSCRRLTVKGEPLIIVTIRNRNSCVKDKKYCLHILGELFSDSIKLQKLKCDKYY